MKNLNVSLSRTVLIGLMVLLTSCVDKKKEENGEAENHQEQEMHDENMTDEHMNHDDKMMKEANNSMIEKSDLTVKESEIASSLIEDYLKIKSALVNDDNDSTQKAGKSFINSTVNFDFSKIEESEQKEVKEILDIMKNHAQHISESEIAEQRKHFAKINADMKNLLKITGSDRMLYQQYCPMYNNNEGGAWLSEAKEVKNPLFGSKMLKCGSIKQIITLK